MENRHDDPERSQIRNTPEAGTESGTQGKSSPAASEPLDSSAELASWEDLVPEWLTIPDIAELLEVKVTRVHSLIKDGLLVALKVGDPAVRKVPATFFEGNEVLDPLPGTLTLLRDAGFSDQEIISWLHTPDDSLPGTPIQALRGEKKTEVRRRAQALAW